MVGAWQGRAQNSGDGLVNPPEPITTNVPARVPVKRVAVPAPSPAAVKTNVVAPAKTNAASKSKGFSKAAKGFSKPAQPRAVSAAPTNVSVRATPPPVHKPDVMPMRPVTPAVPVVTSVPAAPKPAPVSPAPAPAPTPALEPVPLPTPTRVVAAPVAEPAPPQVPTAPTAMTVQPVIPGFDPEEFLEAEKTMVEAITNLAPSEEIILELKYDNIELLDLIKGLAFQAELNILFDPQLVSQTSPDGQPMPQPIVPSFTMKNVTAKQALEAILDNYSYQMLHDPKTQTYRVTRKTGPMPEPLITRIIKLKHSNPTNLVQVIQAVVTDRGSVTPYARTQQMIISATEDQWVLVNQLLDELDTPMKQVLIEANILETARNPQTIRGIDWSGTLQAQNFGFGNGSVSGSVGQERPGTSTTTTQTLPSGRTVTTTATADANRTESLLGSVGGLVPGFSVNTRDGVFPSVGFLNADGVRGVLSFLNSDSETEVIATPRAVMMDGEEARLEVTRAFPIFEITPGSANSPAGASITYTNMGTILQVTPTVVADDNVHLRVTPEVSNIDGKDVQTINGAVNEANIYAIRRIETSVRVPSSHTLVMGGLINETTTDSYNKVPLLGDIPGIGRAFRKEEKLKRKQNLLIFITPTILEMEHFQPPQTDFLHGANQPTGDDFLRSRVPEQRPEREHFMDSAKPYDFKKKKSGFFKWGSR